MCRIKHRDWKKLREKGEKGKEKNMEKEEVLSCLFFCLLFWEVYYVYLSVMRVNHNMAHPNYYSQN
jgi:hypothetical protein